MNDDDDAGGDDEEEDQIKASECYGADIFILRSFYFTKSIYSLFHSLRRVIKKEGTSVCVCSISRFNFPISNSPFQE
jgi:hypothetical protein